MSVTTVKVESPPDTPCPQCGRRHQLWRRLAACVLPNALWISGSGRWASISRCPHPYPPGPSVTVQLYRDEKAARAAKAVIDELGCGGNCHRRHAVTDLASHLVRR